MPETNGIANGAHNGAHSLNPFAKRDEFSRQAILTYKITTILSWLILVVTSVYFTFKAPDDGKHRRTIWGPDDHRSSPFSMNRIIVSVYWIVMYVLQIGYSWGLYASNAEYVNAAATVGPHFVVHNLLTFGFLNLWVRYHFWIAELLLIVNFFNLTSAYFRHSTTPRFIHIPVLSGPLAWNFVALYWCGAQMVHAHNLGARIIANLFIWGIFAFGGFFLVAFKDYTMGFNLSVLAASIGVAQFFTKVFAFQWIFAFVNMGLLFVLSSVVAFPQLIGREPFKRGAVVSEDRERAPLLDDERP